MLCVAVILIVSFFIKCNKVFYLFLLPQLILLILFGFAYLFVCLDYFIHSFSYSHRIWLNLNLLYFLQLLVYMQSIFFFFFVFFRFICAKNRKKSKFYFNTAYISFPLASLCCMQSFSIWKFHANFTVKWLYYFNGYSYGFLE